VNDETPKPSEPDQCVCYRLEDALSPELWAEIRDARFPIGNVFTTPSTILRDTWTETWAALGDSYTGGTDLRFKILARGGRRGRLRLGASRSRDREGALRACTREGRDLGARPDEAVVSLIPIPGRIGSFIDDQDGSVITIGDYVEAPPLKCDGCKASQFYVVQSPTGQPFCEACAKNLGLVK
jgi:hypothetical protein